MGPSAKRLLSGVGHPHFPVYLANLALCAFGTDNRLSFLRSFMGKWSVMNPMLNQILGSP